MFSDLSLDPNSFLSIIPGLALVLIPPAKAVPGALLSYGNCCFPMEEGFLASLTWEKMAHECRKGSNEARSRSESAIPGGFTLANGKQQLKNSDSTTIKFSRFGVDICYIGVSQVCKS